MSEPRRYEMVVAVDGGDDAALVLDHAFDHAGRHERPSLHVLRVVAPARWHRTASPEVADAAAEALRALVLERLSAFVRTPGDWRVQLHVRRGRPSDEIVELASEVEADLIVVGAGALGAEVLLRAPAPVLSARVPERGEDELRRKQCPACVEIRAASNGERWFCEEHHGGYFGTSTLLMPTASNSLRGGPMW